MGSRSGERLRLSRTIRRLSPFSKYPDGNDTNRQPSPDHARSPSPARADAQRNVELLIAAAREAFTAHGPNASLDDIARAAGVGAGTLYRHFPTRLALFEAVYRDSVERLCADGERLAETEPPAEALVDWLKGFVTVVSQKRGLAAALTEEGRTSELFVQCHTMINATGATLLDRAKAAGAVREDLALGDLLKMAKAFALALRPHRREPPSPSACSFPVDGGLRPRNGASPRSDGPGRPTPTPCSRGNLRRAAATSSSFGVLVTP
jgi:AcrR family transcriptional regulator